MLVHIFICVLFIALVAYVLISNNRLQTVAKERYLTARKQLSDALALSESAKNTTVAFEAYGMLKQSQAKLDTLIHMLGGADNASVVCNVEDIAVIVSDIDAQTLDVAELLRETAYLLRAT